MSFNIRGFSCRSDGINGWENRAALSAATIRRYAPDLIGLQEARAESLAAYGERLPGYARIPGQPAGNGAPHEFNAILFDHTKLEVLDSGGFWLSETPHLHSPAWRTSVVRSANWAKFLGPDTGLSFFHLNTHLDHRSSLARARGSDLILRETARLRGNGLPAVVTGDFNCLPGSVPYRSFVEDGFEDTFFAAGGKDARHAGTFHAFGGLRHLLLRCHDRVRHGRTPRRIDWILLKDGRRLRTEAHAILRDRDGESGIYPSDPLPDARHAGARRLRRRLRRQLCRAVSVCFLAVRFSFAGRTEPGKYGKGGTDRGRRSRKEVEDGRSRPGSEARGSGGSV